MLEDTTIFTVCPEGGEGSRPDALTQCFSARVPCKPRVPTEAGRGLVSSELWWIDLLLTLTTNSIGQFFIKHQYKESLLH